MEPVVKSQAVGTIQYIEWLVLNDRVQPSFIAGVTVGESAAPNSCSSHGSASCAATYTIQ